MPEPDAAFRATRQSTSAQRAAGSSPSQPDAVPRGNRDELHPVGKRIERAAAQRFGVLRARDLQRLGVAPDAIRRRVHAGTLFRKYRGVYAVGRERLTPQGEWQAALDAVGGDAWISHQSARELHGWARPLSYPIHVSTTKRGRRQRPQPFDRRRLQVHVVSGTPELTVKDRLRVSAATQLIAELAPTLTARRLLRLCSQAAFDGQYDRIALLDRLGRGRAGSANLRQVLATLDIGQGVTHEELEHAFRRLIERHGIRSPVFNRPIRARGRTLVPDALWPELRFLVELDSRLAHGNEVALFNDGEKDLIYAELGFEHRRLTWWHVVHQEERTAAVLLARVGGRS